MSSSAIRTSSAWVDGKGNLHSRSARLRTSIGTGTRTRPRAQCELIEGTCAHEQPLQHASVRLRLCRRFGFHFHLSLWLLLPTSLLVLPIGRSINHPMEVDVSALALHTKDQCRYGGVFRQRLQRTLHLPCRVVLQFYPQWGSFSG